MQISKQKYMLCFTSLNAKMQYISDFIDCNTIAIKKTLHRETNLTESGEIAQMVKRLTVEWEVLGSNPGGG